MWHLLGEGELMFKKLRVLPNTHKSVYTVRIYLMHFRFMGVFPFQVEILFFSDSVLMHHSSNFPDHRKNNTGDGCHARSVLVMFMLLLVASYHPLCDMIMFSSGHSVNKNKPTNSSSFHQSQVTASSRQRTDSFPGGGGGYRSSSPRSFRDGGFRDGGFRDRDGGSQRGYREGNFRNNGYERHLKG